MDALLHEGTNCLTPARRGARSRALGNARANRGSKRRFAPGRVGLAALVLCVPLAGRFAAAQDVKRGEDLLVRNCASCHAVGRSGESPHKLAPPFRTLGQRYPIESLEEALGEGIMSGHPDMPEFRFDADDVGAIIAYLKSIQQR
jgi:cytochrome c